MGILAGYDGEPTAAMPGLGSDAGAGPGGHPRRGGRAGAAVRAARSSAAAVATAVTVALFAASAASAAGPSPFRHDLRRIDSRFRTAIEYAPEELGEGLGASETVCRLAQEAERQGDREGAGADWGTLSQLVEELDRPAAAKVEGAAGRADGALRDLRRRYAAGWSDRGRVAKLRRGVARAREGARMLRAAVETIVAAFDAWPEHRCQAAVDGIEAGVAQVPAAVTRVNAGMRLLWELAFPKL